jgi:hypothetical protein
MADRSAAEAKEQNIKAMGEKLGTQYTELGKSWLN